MKRFVAALCALTLVIAAVRAADEKLVGKCPVSGKDIVKDASVDYKGAKVYFCCPGCPDAFKADTAKYASKANQQLVQTKQATQEKCPLSGGKLNPDTAVKVGEVSVTFCCNMCKGKVEKAEGDAQRDLVFADAAFEKGFKVGK
jgi:YHS domain-containing protein